MQFKVISFPFSEYIDPASTIVCDAMEFIEQNTPAYHTMHFEWVNGINGDIVSLIYWYCPIQPKNLKRLNDVLKVASEVRKEGYLSVDPINTGEFTKDHRQLYKLVDGHTLEVLYTGTGLGCIRFIRKENDLRKWAQVKVRLGARGIVLD